MKILVINGSPKGERSNTYKLTRAFLDGIKSVNGDDTEIAALDINKLNIKSCLGCFACWDKTPGRCCISDDMQGVIEKLLWADITVWSFPLYYFNVPGKLKCLIDRQLPMILPFMNTDTVGGGHPTRYDMSGKKTVIISTCGFYTAENNYESVTAMFDHICGKGNYTAVFCGQGELFRVKELSQRTEEYLGFIRTAGKEYISGGISADTRDKLNTLLYPRDVFERMADASWGIDTKSGEKQDDSLVFTKQMAAMYRKESYGGRDIVLDMHYTDIDKKYRIILGKDGSRVAEDFLGEYTTLIETPISVWKAIAVGEISGTEAMARHMYSVSGDFEVMINWDNYFGSGKSESSTSNSPAARESKTNMLLLLLPWMFFWIFPAINSEWGTILSLAVCLIEPLIFYKSKKTLYDLISCAAAGCCSVGVIMGLPIGIVQPVSYFAFGFMWAITCLMKIPLTAYYSMNDYGGSKALENCLFVKTNRILTAVWGIMYILSSVWSYFLMRTALSPYIGLINSILPMLIGIFTVWFQKWYPKAVAAGKIK